MEKNYVKDEELNSLKIPKIFFQQSANRKNSLSTEKIHKSHRELSCNQLESLTHRCLPTTKPLAVDNLKTTRIGTKRIISKQLEETLKETINNITVKKIIVIII